MVQWKVVCDLIFSIISIMTQREWINETAIENLSHIDFSNLINLRQICCNEERHEYNSRYLMR
ncbi:hypothetical protein VVMO6_01866 [Vibrio vulnificus MO6-24/O]|uniref:Uncharacterized protein n=1 Tax=Vibrio vulnificus TaxID=672 RepID=A0AAN1UCD1_VIBVL|nr:hypothetical protein VVMO6_01866 [Vibrio vulnificus MO6-24/O]AXX60173.1 hypothetical protein FORC53_1834 [Vibrio vulnificus]OJI54685.1 hypothetical protein VV1062A_02241 [Vibrio vulnificus]QBH27478.1 hypothetical protein FORC77_1755 [Vibrio vulnificus]